MIMPKSLNKNIRAVFSATPGAVKRQGEKLFVKVPLYKSKKRHMPIYINRELFKKLFSCSREPTWEEMSSALEKVFSSTIEKEKSTGKKIGIAYADRQKDPLGLSLAGNRGSGRAYYVGGIFNIKGERTPLATSKQKKFSDGLLEMERCVWEALVGNALQGSITTGLNGVLAILDMNELCEVEWRDEPVKRGKVIRVDMEGELDRITHLFHRKRPLKEGEWEICARSYGRLEGDKFIERIIHGAWSPGNISLRGHLVDFDTVAAVKGRSPQFSATRWHHENYFGTEHHGQLNVLKAMTSDRYLNKNCANFKKLKAVTLSAMREQIAKRFIMLMGFKDEESLYARYRLEIDDITELWIELARKGYKKYEELFSKEPLSTALQVFDTSAFFRIYPMLKRFGLFVPEEAVARMSTSAVWRNPYETVDDKTFSAIAQRHLKKVYAVIGEHFVTSDEMFQLLRVAALGFVKKYDRLHEKILKETKADIKEVEARAYVINEDRFYMFPAYTASYKIARNDAGWSSAELNRIIEALILSCKRSLDGVHQVYICNMRLYKEGYLYTCLDGKGSHQAIFSFYSQRRKLGNAYVQLEYGNIKLHQSMNNRKICKITSKPILHTNKAKLIYGQRTHVLKSILD